MDTCSSRLSVWIISDRGMFRPSSSERSLGMLASSGCPTIVPESWSTLVTRRVVGGPVCFPRCGLPAYEKLAYDHLPTAVCLRRWGIIPRWPETVVASAQTQLTLGSLPSRGLRTARQGGVQLLRVSGALVLFSALPHRYLRHLERYGSHAW